ncbi:MAG: PD-(D/E)XK nuclease family protein [Magnetococcales bacterium]|nr:PD-(D/E)XK nuclease family protein [Magnetococcales bacterium]
MLKKAWDLDLQEGWVVLTVNRRLARYIDGLYEQQKKRDGQIIWSTPDIMPFSAWLEKCWLSLLDEAITDFALLSEEQERVVWQEVVSSSSNKGSLLWTDSAAHGAQQAWNLLESWLIELPESETVGNDDASAFYQWSKSFEAKCQQEKWLPKAAMVQMLTLNLDKINKPKGVILAGFNEIPANQKQLLSSLEKLGVAVVIWQEQKIEPDVEVLSCHDVNAEIIAAANWARLELERELDQGQGSEDVTGSSIGIIVPELQNLRGKIIRIFSEVFYPGRPQQAPFPDQSIFNISLGAPLLETPMIRDGMLLLELSRSKLSWQDWGAILNSPYLAGGDVEWSCRGLLDAALRRQGAMDLSIADIALSSATNAPLLHSRLTAVQDFLGNEEWGDGFVQTPGRWANCFDKLLQILGWPGDGGLNSQEFQCVESWKKVLGVFASLEMVLPEIDLDIALSELKELVGTAIFQPVEAEAKVQILGVLEAEGEIFDSLWLLGLTDKVWPKIPEPNPFIPVAFQRKHDLPRSSSQRELRYAKQLTNRILTSSNKVIVSYHEWEGEMQQKKSPLISSIKQVDIKDILKKTYPTLADVILAQPGMSFQEEQPLPVFLNDEPITGGTSVIKSQAQCPFSAFAKFRLNAHPLEEPQQGFNAGERGEITHASLASFWGEVGSSANLNLMSYQQRDSLIFKVTSRAVKAQSLKSGNSISKPYLQLEIKRQKRLLLTWLGVEERREAPFNVVERESEGSIKLGGVVINFRIDRVDSLDSGELVVVDYKTGAANVSSWFSERPHEPQMLLYAMANADKLAALVYGQLATGKLRYMGLAHTDGIIPALDLLEDGKYTPDHMDWQSLIADWSTVVGQLAEQYRLGEHAVDPLEKACEWCDLPVLCRVAAKNYSQPADLDLDEGVS